MSEDFDLVDEQQAGKIVKVEPHTLAVWRCRQPHKAPPYVRLGRKVYYRRADLREWIAGKVVRPQAESAA